MRSEAAMQHGPLQESYLAARRLFDAKRYADSLQVCQEALALSDSGESRVFLCLSQAMNEYYLGEFAALERTVAAMETMDLPDVVRCRWLMLKGRVLAHRRQSAAFAAFAEAEQEFRRLNIEQDEAWAQLSAARLALILGDTDTAKACAGRVCFALYLPKAYLLQAEADYAIGDFAGATRTTAQVDLGAFGPPDDVDLARSAYIKAACALHSNNLVDAGLYLGEARNRALQTEQHDFELLNCIEKLMNRLESEGG